jgi:hypothetical protein
MGTHVAWCVQGVNETSQIAASVRDGGGGEHVGIATWLSVLCDGGTCSTYCVTGVPVARTVSEVRYYRSVCRTYCVTGVPVARTVSEVLYYRSACSTYCVT